MRSRHREQDVEHLLRGGAIRDPHPHVDAAQAVGQRPVGHLLRDEARVGDDNLCALPGAHGAGGSVRPGDRVDDR